jgi:hypothetical protein
MTTADARAACLGLIASFKALELSKGRRHPVILDPRSFFTAALPLLGYLMFDDGGDGTRGAAPHLMRDVDPHLVLAGRSSWRDDEGQLRVQLDQLTQAGTDADSRYSGACFWQAGPLPLYVPYTGENRVDACAALGITIRAQVHQMIVPGPTQLRLRPIRAGGWALELLSQVEGRQIPADDMIAPLPFPAAVPLLRAMGVPAGPPLPGFGLKYKAFAFLERRLSPEHAIPDQRPPPPAPTRPDLTTGCDGTKCLPTRLPGHPETGPAQ